MAKGKTLFHNRSDMMEAARNIDDILWSMMERATGLHIPREDEARGVECVMDVPVQGTAGEVLPAPPGQAASEGERDGGQVHGGHHPHSLHWLCRDVHPLLLWQGRAVRPAAASGGGREDRGGGSQVAHTPGLQLPNWGRVN